MCYKAIKQCLLLCHMTIWKGTQVLAKQVLQCGQLGTFTHRTAKAFLAHVVTCITVNNHNNFIGSKAFLAHTHSTLLQGRASKNCSILLLFPSTEIFSKRRKIYTSWRETRVLVGRGDRGWGTDDMRYPIMGHPSLSPSGSPTHLHKPLWTWFQLAWSKMTSFSKTYPRA